MLETVSAPRDPPRISYIVIPPEATAALLRLLSRRGVDEPQFTLHRCEQGVALRIFTELDAAVREELTALGGEFMPLPTPPVASPSVQ